MPPGPGLTPETRDPGHEITLNSVTDNLEVSASVEVVNLAEGGTTRLAEMLTPDGRVYIVDLALEGTASYIVVGVSGDTEASFEFDNRAEAEAFRDQIHDILRPDAKDIVFGGFGMLPLVKATESAWYAKDYEDNLVSLRTEAGGLVEADTRAAVGNRRLHGEVAATARFFADPIADEYGMVIDLAAGGTAAWGGARADVDVTAEAEFLTNANGDVQRVTITLELQAQGAMDLTNPLLDIVGGNPADLVNIEMTGGQATVTAVLDVTNDENWALATGLAGGDVTNVPALIDRSDILIQTGRVKTVDHFSGGLSVPGPTHEIGAGVSVSTTNYTSTGICTKPPGGAITRVGKTLRATPGE